MEANDLHLKQMDFRLNNDRCRVTFHTEAGAEYPVEFGANKWVEGTTERLGPYLVQGIKNQFVGLPPAKVAGSYGWVDEHTLQLKLRYIESPHSEAFTCYFNGKNMRMEYEKSNDFGGKKLALKGHE